MSAKAVSQPAWLDSEAITTALSRKRPPENAVVKDILAKSLALEPLTLDEITALLRVQDQEDSDRILAAADLVKQKVYGDRIVITAPLHIDSQCASECLYCSYRAGNQAAQKKRLSLAEIREAALKLIRQGHKRLVLVSGQATEADVEYFTEAINAIFHLSEDQGEIRRINLDIGALEPEEYDILKDADVGNINIYQETYHEASYKAAHPAGPKSDYGQRLHAPDVALENGIKDVALGLNLGLGPADFDLLALSCHARHLSGEFGACGRAVNLHRCRPAPGCSFNPPYPLNDAEFLRYVAITRLAIPYTGIILATSEPENAWRGGCNAGASQLIAGSLANPYATWLNAPNETIPFPTGEDTHLDEVVRFLIEEGRHLPSFCTACPRLGRNGAEFISMVASGDIKTQCGPNSIASFLEFLLNYATPFTKQAGEELIAKKLASMDSHDRRSSERLLDKVRCGRADEFI